MEPEILAFRGALIEEQGATFAVVEVAPDVLRAGNRRITEERARYASIFRDVPVVLAAREATGRTLYSGRPDIVRFLSSAGWARIPWKRYRARKQDHDPFREWA